MYVIPIILVMLALCMIIIFHFKKKKIIRKIRNMTVEERRIVLNDIAHNFGYCYEPSQDIFSSTVDAWQRNFGFTYAYDIGAPYFNMVYDFQPIYFDYDAKTWMIELWKGQYGINTGCEIGIYHADSIVPPEDYKKTLFACASDDEMLPLSVTLRKNGRCLGMLNRPHWWLTIFDMGMFSFPGKLSMEVSITFPDCRMQSAFCRAMRTAMPDTRLSVSGHTVSFIFMKCRRRFSLWQKIVRSWALIWCRIFCSLFCFITRPFKRCGNKVLYLYYYLPFAFRKMLRLRRIPKNNRRRLL